MSSKINVFEWWIERGFNLLPVQPGTKYLYPGWGQYKNKISLLSEAEKTIRGNDNLAVLADDKKIILDFDDADLYTFWSNKNPTIAQTYTERTPRGGAHVFFCGSVPAGLILVDKIEIKNVCLVSPSLVDGKRYTRGMGEILEADPNQIFSSLSKPGTRTVYALQADQRRKINTNSSGLIELIKSHWTVAQVLSLYHPEIKQHQRGEVITCLCPFHNEQTPSFYIMPNGIWGCHACHIRGDVINLYARFEEIPVREAIGRMAQSLGVRP